MEINMLGRTWKNIGKLAADHFKNYLIKNGGKEQEIKNSNEVWRVRLSDSTFTYYKTGTLYSTPSNLKDPIVFSAWDYIDSLFGTPYILPTKDFLIGFDETGKGEVIGHIFLVGVSFPKEIFKDITGMVGSADTKKHHSFEYWDKIFAKLNSLKRKGFDFIYEKISPSEIDKYNLNKLMDKKYKDLLSLLLKKHEVNKCRIVIDDYRVGPLLKDFLNSLSQKGAEIIIEKKSEDKYLETKSASLISKRLREKEIKEINENLEFQINGLSIGSGNVKDPKTESWLKLWWEKNRSWPWFVRRSFKNIKSIEGKK